MTTLAIFGAFFGGILKGWLGGSGSPVKLDKIVRKDRESQINRRARKRVKR